MFSKQLNTSRLLKNANQNHLDGFKDSFPSEGACESRKCVCIVSGMVWGFSARMASTAMCTLECGVKQKR